MPALRIIKNNSTALMMSDKSEERSEYLVFENGTSSSMLPHLMMIQLPNCTYRYDYSPTEDTPEQVFIRSVSLWLDGPATIVAMIMALIGCYFAMRFLANANLQRELTATLYTLCICDTFLVSMVLLYHSIEATSILVTDENWMWNQQSCVLLTHGLVATATTSSTLLVIYITFLRFCAVWWPLKYGRLRDRCGDTFRKQHQPTASKVAERCSSSGVEDGGGLTTTAVQLLPSEPPPAPSPQQHPPPLQQRLTAVNLTKMVSKRFHRQHSSVKSNSQQRAQFRKMLRHFVMPGFAVLFSFAINSTVFVEFELVPCIALEGPLYKEQFSMQLNPTLKMSKGYNAIRALVHFCTQTIGPVFVIMFLTTVTEYKVYVCLRARRKLFESQQRRCSLVAVEELREKLSRYVAIFIAVKFLILRSLPTFFDVYEAFYGIEEFGQVISVLVRLSDFGIVLNAATNSFCYFGRTRFFENRLRRRQLRRRQLQMQSENCSKATGGGGGSARSADILNNGTSMVSVVERATVSEATPRTFFLPDKIRKHLVTLWPQSFTASIQRRRHHSYTDRSTKSDGIANNNNNNKKQSNLNKLHQTDSIASESWLDMTKGRTRQRFRQERYYQQNGVDRTVFRQQQKVEAKLPAVNNSNNKHHSISLINKNNRSLISLKHYNSSK